MLWIECSRYGRFKMLTPGDSSNLVVFWKCPLREDYINRLALGRHVTGDNACICGEHLLTPFSGAEKNELWKDAYNFYVSQLSLRIEMAFGMMSNRWRIRCAGDLQVSVMRDFLVDRTAAAGLRQPGVQWGKPEYKLEMSQWSKWKPP